MTTWDEMRSSGCLGSGALTRRGDHEGHATCPASPLPPVPDSTASQSRSTVTAPWPGPSCTGRQDSRQHGWRAGSTQGMSSVAFLSGPGSVGPLCTTPESARLSGNEHGAIESHHNSYVSPRVTPSIATAEV